MSLKRLLLLVILLRHSVGFIANRRISRARLCGKKGWSEQEDALLVIAQDRWGAKAWERIAEVLPERTEREIRSRAKWRKTVKVPKNSGFSEFGARALGGFREEAATRATAIVDAADPGRRRRAAVGAGGQCAKAPPAKQAGGQPPKFEMPKFDVARRRPPRPSSRRESPRPRSCAAGQGSAGEAAGVAAADVRGARGRRGREAAAAEAAAAATRRRPRRPRRPPRAAEEVVPAVAPEAAAPATGDGPAYSKMSCAACSRASRVATPPRSRTSRARRTSRACSTRAT